MAKKALGILKQFFLAGKKPTEAQFHDTLDSFVHKDDGAVDSNYVNQRIDEALENYTLPEDYVPYTGATRNIDINSKFLTFGSEERYIVYNEETSTLGIYAGEVGYVSIGGGNGINFSSPVTMTSRFLASAITFRGNGFINQLAASYIQQDRSTQLPDGDGTLVLSVNGISADDQGNIDLPSSTTMNGYTRKTNNYALTTKDDVVNFTGASNATFTLPTAVGIAGKKLTVKNSSTAILTVSTTSSQTIDGSTSKTFSTSYSGMTVLSDGANWIVINNISPVS